MWCHLPTGFGARRVLRFSALLLLLVAFITTLFFAGIARAAPTTSKTINFQGRLQTAAGAVVADGFYNMQFKIYQDGTGTAVGNPGGSLKWTETHINNGGTNGIEVRNGFFSINLGADNPFGTSVDWNEDTLFLSMNVAGSSVSCTTFGTAPCADDGEMLPMKRITATPYAINAGAVGGKTADNFVQLAQGVQTDASANTSSIHINKVGSGNFLQLQNVGEDVLAINQNGDLQFGGASDHVISVGTAASDTQGGSMRVSAGNGGDGSGNEGGTLVLQGGNAGGTNANGGNVAIDAGTGSGSGYDGYVSIGTSTASNIIIGSTYQPIYQGVYLGANDTEGSWTDVTIGTGGSASGGSTSIRGKTGVTIETNGTTRATFSDTTNTVYFGNGVSSATPSDSAIQGTNSSAAAVAGGSLTVQGGNATTGDTNGGNLILSGGSGSGNGSSGLVVINTPTFSTVANDANCYTGGAIVANSCTITSTSVDTSAAIIVGFSSTNQTASLPDPTITTAGRIMYIMAAGDSQDFVLSVNGGGAANQITLRKNSAATLIWNGSDWITTAGSSSTSLQNAYDNTPQSAGGDELLLNNTASTGGLTIRDSSTNPVDSNLLEVKNSSANSLFSVNNTVTNGAELTSDGNVNDAGSFDENWLAVGNASVEHNTSDGQEANNSAEVAAGTATDNGVRNKLSVNPASNTRYRVSAFSKLVTGSAFNDFTVRYSPDNGSNFIECTDYSTRIVNTTGWAQITCNIETDATAATDPYLYIIQPTSAASARTFLVDSLSFTLASNNTANVKVGTGAGQGDTTLFTLDKAAEAMTADNESLLGSMYYDTTKGKVQCYEAEGWGACGSSPDSFITISPEYTNAVMNGTDIGTITSDLCSDTLNINDGSSAQPTICGTNETYNFYRWTSAESATQTRSIYVTYQLPTNFKKFVPGSTSLMGRTNNGDAGVTYQIYRDNSSTGLTSCGSNISVSTGAQSSWLKGLATGGSDPANCTFAAGDSILFRINLTAKTDANAYVSNLGFTFSNDG